MKIIKKVAVFSTVGVLSISSFACARNNDNGEIRQELSRVLDVNVENGEAVSSVLESEFGVSISDEASEYLDSSYVQAALKNSMNDADYQQFANVSYQYFAQRLKEDNPEYENANIAVSYEDNPVISVDNEVYLPDDTVGEYLDDFYSLQQGITSRDEQVAEYAEDVARDMMMISLADLQMTSSFLGEGQVFVKGLK